MSNRLIGYQSGQGFLYDLSGASKMLFFILVSVACMATYDPRFILAVGLLSIYLFNLAKIRWRDISFVVKIIGSIALFNLLMVYLFAPGYGEEIYRAKTVIIEGWGRFYLTSQELFYLANLLLKYFSTVPLAILFIRNPNLIQASRKLTRMSSHEK